MGGRGVYTWLFEGRRTGVDHRNRNDAAVAMRADTKHIQGAANTLTVAGKKPSGRPDALVELVSYRMPRLLLPTSLAPPSLARGPRRGGCLASLSNAALVPITPPVQPQLPTALMAETSGARE
ncbi:hypothetical protein MRX96_047996 [Rhipicephalus microplus]